MCNLYYKINPWIPLRLHNNEFMKNNKLYLKYFFIVLTLLIMALTVYLILTGTLLTQDETQEIIDKSLMNNND